MPDDRQPRTARLNHARAHLRRADPVMRSLVDAQPDFDPRAWLADLPPMDAFGALVFQVAGQQLSIGATRRILHRLTQHFGGRFPTPSQVLATSPALFLSTGLSGRKVATLRAAADRFADGSLSDDALRRSSDAEVEAALTTIPGVGPWTVHGLLIIALEREDVALPGDVALQRAVQQAYGLDHRPSPDEVSALAERWRPYRSLATAYLFQTVLEPQRAEPTPT